MSLHFVPYLHLPYCHLINILGKGEHYIADVLHDFEARDEAELSILKGQTLRLAPKQLQPPGLRGWLLAAASSSNTSGINSSEALYFTGLVPANRIKVIGRRMGVVENEQLQGKEKPDVVKSLNN